MTDVHSDMLEGDRTAVADQGPMRGIARGGSANLVGSLVTALANFALTFVVLRALSKAEAGTFFSATSLFMLLAGVGQLGTNIGLVYFLPRSRARGRAGDASAYFRTAMTPVLVSGALMGVGLFVFAPQIAEAISPGHQALAATYLRDVAVFIPFTGAVNVTLSATRGLGTMRPNATVELIGRPLVQFTLVALVALLLGDGILGWAWGVSYVPAAAVAWCWWRSLSARVPPLPPGPALSREFWRFTMPRALTGVVQAASQRLDIVLVAALAGPAAAAVYAAASRFIVAGQMGNNAISLAAQPPLSLALARGNRTEVNHIYQVSTAWLMIITWPLYLLLTVFGGLLLNVFGSGYGSGGTVLLVLSGAMLLGTGFGMVDMVLAMAGHTTWNLINAALALAVQLALDFWLIPDHGILGAAVGWAGAIVTRNTAALLQVAAALRLHPFGRATATSAAVAVFAFLVLPLAVRMALGDSWTALMVACVAGTALYGGLLWTCRSTLELGVLSRARRRPHGSRK
jgi:O-antigen/teichoic acid export membrane protein